MPAIKQSDRIRGIVKEHYVKPALKAGTTHLSIRARDVLKDAEATEGFPRGRTPLICNVLLSKKLLHENNLQIERVDGPPSKQSRTVVVHYRVLQVDGAGLADASHLPAVASESSAARAKRLTDKLRGLLKSELAEYGGAEGFMRWIRSDDEFPG